jgi:hypothetical protein
MEVFARGELAAKRAALADPCLLLEGAWPNEPGRAGHWSLDESIDERRRWIDRAAAELVQRLGDFRLTRPAGAPGRAADATGEMTFAYLNALALRYYFVKLLRVVAFFDQVRPPEAGEIVRLHAVRGRDDEYVDLFLALAQARGFELQLAPHEDNSEIIDGGEASQAWRRWAARIDRLLPAAANAKNGERIVLCGNPRLLEPICEALAARGCRLWWLYERFAVRSWWCWRRRGVGQLVCEGAEDRPYRYSDGGPICDLNVRGVDLSRPVERWLTRQAAKHGAAQSRWIARIDEHFSEVRPTGLVLDEDATPFKRAAIGLARRRECRSLVVQHGAPCGPFGFAPQAADRICVWGESSREQLLHWGVAPDRVCITGWPHAENRRVLHSAAPKRRRSAGKRILLLATMPPDDGRPDTAGFHLTRQTHERMLAIACDAVARLPRATLTIKLHPRCGDEAVFRQALARRAELRAKIVRTRPLDRLIAESDCVLSCASTSGIEAALAGAPVVQLLPVGSGDVLPADRWGLLGSARDQRELDALLDRALARGWSARESLAQTLAGVCSYDPARSAADRIADALLEPGRVQPASADGTSSHDIGRLHDRDSRALASDALGGVASGSK